MTDQPGGNTPSPAALEALRARINQLPWHHQIDFGNGILSPGNTKLDVLRAQADVYFRDGVQGRSVLDVGCWDGFNSFDARVRGASRVLATDHFAWSEKCWGKRECIDIAHAALGIDIEILDIDLPAISRDSLGGFDIVLFLGIFYHLRNPFLALEQAAAVCDDLIIIETHLDAMDQEKPAMIFYPTNQLANDPSNWWGPNPACIMAMLFDLGFSSEYTPHPVYGNRGIFHGRRRK